MSEQVYEIIILKGLCVWIKVGLPACDSWIALWHSVNKSWHTSLTQHVLTCFCVYVCVQIQMYQLTRLLHDYHRELYNHFEEHEICPSLYAAPWFLTLFASQFPLGFVSRIFGIYISFLLFLFRLMVCCLSHAKLDMIIELSAKPYSLRKNIVNHYWFMYCLFFRFCVCRGVWGDF